MSIDIENVLGAKTKPKEKQRKLVTAVCQGKIPAKSLIDYFVAAPDVDKGTLADVMKHVSAEKPQLLAPYIDTLIRYVNHRAPRVKWGVAEAIGNLAGTIPDDVARAIPSLLRNASESEANTTVVRWCAAYALSQIARNSRRIRKQLVPTLQRLMEREGNNGVRNLYARALKAIESER